MEEVDAACQTDEDSVKSLVTEVTGLEALVVDVAFCQVEEERELQPF